MLKYVKLTTFGWNIELYYKKLKINTMKTKKIVIDNRPKFKLQLDNRTTITVRSTIALKAWQERYPAAKILD